MPLNFPDAPNVNDTFSSNSRTWRWNGTTWDLVPIMHTHAVADLVDFNVASPATGQALVFNGTKWANNSNITETIIANKAPLANPTFSGTVTAPTFVGKASQNYGSALLYENVAYTNRDIASMQWAPSGFAGAGDTLTLKPSGNGTIWNAPGILGVCGDGAVVAAANTGTARLRNTWLSTAAPSGGIDGDVWLTYTP